MRLLIIVPAQDRATGNWVTATRFQQGLGSLGHTVMLDETAGDAERLRSLVTAAGPDLVLLLHAWRSGRPWLESGARHPFAVLLTGTDVNLGMRDPSQAPVIATVLRRAAAIISQNPLTAEQLCREQPHLADRIHYLPPGIICGDTPFPLRERLGSPPGELLCLCPAGIRPVKAVLELIGMCKPLIREGRPLRLAFCGPILDEGYGKRFLAEVAVHPWVSYLGIVPPDAMPAALGQADVVISNSASEGLPNTLVEAAALGRPVIARAIPGNAAVIADRVNGLLFHDEDSLLAAIRQLQDDPALRATLSHPDPERFAPKREAGILEDLCREILSSEAANRQTRQM
jgi:glycosyltransferase involved in cell wall biosynthesis